MPQQKRSDDDLAQGDVLGDDGPKLGERNAQNLAGNRHRGGHVRAFVAENVHDADELPGVE